MNIESDPSIAPNQHDVIKQRVAETFFYKDSLGIDFDPTIFSEAFDDLEKEFIDANPETRRSILMRRFFDARAELDPEKESRFTQKYAIRIPTFTESELKQLGITDYGNIQDRLLRSKTRFDSAHAPTVHQYGPSLVINVKAGEMVTMERLGAEDILGTSFLTACSALILMADNRLSLYHIRMSDAETIDTLLSTESYSRAVLIAPEVDTGRETDALINEKIEKMRLKYPQLKTSQFPYWASDMRNNPHDIDSTSVLVGKDFIRQVGIKERRKAGGKDALHLEIRDKSVSDIQL